MRSPADVAVNRERLPILGPRHDHLPHGVDVGMPRIAAYPAPRVALSSPQTQKREARVHAVLNHIPIRPDADWDGMVRLVGELRSGVLTNHPEVVSMQVVRSGQEQA